MAPSPANEYTRPGLSIKSKAVVKKRGIWTREEDDLLRAAVRKHGATRWNDISALLPSRSSKSCRLRWCNQLQPAINKDPFSKWEDAVIWLSYLENGGTWAAIARLLPRRTDNAVKNRYNCTLLRLHRILKLKNCFLSDGYTLRQLLSMPEQERTRPCADAAPSTPTCLIGVADQATVATRPASTSGTDDDQTSAWHDESRSQYPDHKLEMIKMEPQQCEDHVAVMNCKDAGLNIVACAPSVAATYSDRDKHRHFDQDQSAVSDDALDSISCLSHSCTLEAVRHDSVSSSDIESASWLPPFEAPASFTTSLQLSDLIEPQRHDHSWPYGQQITPNSGSWSNSLAMDHISLDRCQSPDSMSTHTVGSTRVSRSTYSTSASYVCDYGTSARPSASPAVDASLEHVTEFQKFCSQNLISSNIPSASSNWRAAAYDVADDAGAFDTPAGSTNPTEFDCHQYVPFY